MYFLGRKVVVSAFFADNVINGKKNVIAIEHLFQVVSVLI
jgi:hypothetical protein